MKQAGHWWRAVLCGLLLVLATQPVRSLDASDAGTFVAVDEDAEPIGKMFRATHLDGRWIFEDRQPDGSWLDVTCHGGCQHVPARPQDLEQWFGGPPPASVNPDCVHNQAFAFCRFDTVMPEQDGHVLVVRVGGSWLPVILVRVPGVPQLPEDAPGDADPPSAQALESA